MRPSYDSCTCCSFAASLACCASSDASWYLRYAPLSRVGDMLPTFGLGTNLVQAVATRLSTFVSRKTRNRLAHALNGNSAMLGGNDALAPLFVFSRSSGGSSNSSSSSSRMAVVVVVVVAVVVVVIIVVEVVAVVVVVVLLLLLVLRYMASLRFVWTNYMHVEYFQQNM